MVADAGGKDKEVQGNETTPALARDRRITEQQIAIDRITVALIPQAGDDLQRLQDRTGLSKTDIVNRAIAVYEFLESQLRAAMTCWSGTRKQTRFRSSNSSEAGPERCLSPGRSQVNRASP